MSAIYYSSKSYEADNDTMEIPPQSMYIQKGTGKKKEVYAFDGVTKVGHSGSVQIEDDSSNAKGSKYTNNAKLQGTEVTVECLMSEVYTTKTKFADKKLNSNRPTSALKVLYKLKDDRKKLTVVTKYRTYKDMLIKSISVEESSENPYGWTGEVVFHEVLTSAGKSTNSNTSQNPTDDTRIPSLGAQSLYK